MQLTEERSAVSTVFAQECFFAVLPVGEQRVWSCTAKLRAFTNLPAPIRGNATDASGKTRVCTTRAVSDYRNGAN